MSWVRKGRVLGLLGGLGLLWLLVVLLFDPMLKRALISSGQAAAGAKVEIASLRTRWLKGTLEIRGIAVADAAEPMRNAVEVGRAAFALDTGALLRGKAVVREAALEGLRFGTARRTSGALPKPPPPSALSRAVQKAIAPAQDETLGALGSVKANAAAEVDAAKLEGLRRLDEAKAKGKEVEERWKGKQAEAKEIEAEAKAVGEQLKALGAGGSSPADILRKAQQAQDAQRRIKGLIARVDAQREQARKDLAEAQSALREADELRRKDLQGLMAAAGLPSFDAQDLGRRLLGARTSARLTTALGWMRWARERSAARKAAAPPRPPRRKGVDVEFPRARVYPQFLLENAKLSGTLDGLFMGKDMELAGRLHGVTSNPRLYGKPALLELSGDAPGAGRLRLGGRLDQQDDPVGVGVSFSGEGFSLAGAALGDGSVGGVIADGRARVSGELRSAGEEWKGEVLVEATGVRVEPKVSLPAPADALVADALRSLGSFKARIGISGREDDLKLAFSTDAGETVAAAMRKAVSGRVEAQRKALQAKLDALYADKVKEARAQADALSAKVLGPLDAQKGALEKQLQEAVGKALGGGGQAPDLRKLFKR